MVKKLDLLNATYIHTPYQGSVKNSTFSVVTGATKILGPPGAVMKSATTLAKVILARWKTVLDPSIIPLIKAETRGYNMRPRY